MKQRVEVLSLDWQGQYFNTQFPQHYNMKSKGCTIPATPQKLKHWYGTSQDQSCFSILQSDIILLLDSIN